LAWLLVISLLAGCASSQVPPMGYQGKPYRPEPDEKQLWSDAEKEEEKLAKLGKVWDDPLLEEYLSGVAAKLVPEEARQAGAPAVRIAVVRDPTLNAFAMPNGKVYLHTGLLSRLENESQLAMILGHELTHVTNRHALRFNRDARNKQIFFTMAGIAAALGVAVAPGQQQGQGNYVSPEVLRASSNVFLGLGLQLAFIAAVNGYGRDLEREADREGLERMVAAGYDPREAPRVFELLKNDHGDGRRLENFFFGNHPRLDERITSTRELLKTLPAPAGTTSALALSAEDFTLRTRTVVRENAALDIRAGRFGLAKAQLDRVLPLAPKDPTTHLYFGDLYRLQAQRAKNPADKPLLLSQAREAYERAAQLDSTFPDPFRQLGLLYYQSKDPEKAKAAFRAYLGLKPDAPDARRIKEYLVELER
jgi:predicted Zn-dependent protease